MRLCSLLVLLVSNVAQISANGSGFVIRVLGRLRGLLPGEVGAQPSGNSGSTESKDSGRWQRQPTFDRGGNRQINR